MLPDTIGFLFASIYGKLWLTPKPVPPAQVVWLDERSGQLVSTASGMRPCGKSWLYLLCNPTATNKSCVAANLGGLSCRWNRSGIDEKICYSTLCADSNLSMACWLSLARIPSLTRIAMYAISISFFGKHRQVVYWNRVAAINFWNVCPRLDDCMRSYIASLISRPLFFTPWGDEPLGLLLINVFGEGTIQKSGLHIELGFFHVSGSSGGHQEPDGVVIDNIYVYLTVVETGSLFVALCYKTVFVSRWVAVGSRFDSESVCWSDWFPSLGAWYQWPSCVSDEEFKFDLDSHLPCVRITTIGGVFVLVGFTVAVTVVLVVLHHCHHSVSLLLGDPTAVGVSAGGITRALLSPNAVLVSMSCGAVVCGLYALYVRLTKSDWSFSRGRSVSPRLHWRVADVCRMRHG